jgi:hypothetical protein
VGGGGFTDPPSGGFPPKEGDNLRCCPAGVAGRFTPYGGEEFTLLERTEKRRLSLPSDLIADAGRGGSAISTVGDSATVRREDALGVRSRWTDTVRQATTAMRVTKRAN